MSAAKLIAAIESRAPDRLLVARALDPTLRDELSATLDYDELPFVRGRTVIPDDTGAGDLVVAGHPNHLGVFDQAGPVPWIAVTGRWSALSPVEEAHAEVALEPAVHWASAGHLLAVIRSRAARLRH